MTCPKGKGGNVWTFLMDLRYKREVLAAAGVHITDKEYQHTLFRGIPDELARFASQLLSATRLVHDASTVDTDTLIGYICEEAERLKNRRAQGQKGQEWDKKGEGLTGEVFAATRSDSGRRKHRKGESSTGTPETGAIRAACVVRRRQHQPQWRRRVQQRNLRPRRTPLSWMEGFWMAEEGATHA